MTAPTSFATTPGNGNTGSAGNRGYNVPPALREALSRLTINPKARPPYIAPQSEHYTFACLVLGGFDYQEACDELGLNPETVRRWRRTLRAKAKAFFGKDVTYELAARYAIEKDFQTVFKQ